MRYRYRYSIERLNRDGWEAVACRPTPLAARRRLREYRRTMPEYVYRVHRLKERLADCLD